MLHHVHANGLDFACLEQVRGPLVQMLHGFPDTAHTWSHQVPALAAAGYRVVAPFLRGDHPTAIPASGWYDKATRPGTCSARSTMVGQWRHFTGEYRYVEVPRAGHFLQREQPGEVTRLVLEWLGR